LGIARKQKKKKKLFAPPPPPPPPPPKKKMGLFLSHPPTYNPTRGKIQNYIN